MPDSTPLTPPPHIPPDVIKEMIRLSELRLAAQLQTRLALEGRLGSSTPWLLAVLVAIASSISSIRSGTEDTKLVFTALTLAIFIAVLLNFSSMLISGKWCYGGETPPSITKHIMLETRANKINAFFGRALKFAKVRNKRPWLIAKHSLEVFDEENPSVDKVLLELAVRYTEHIARNDDYLRSIRIMANTPIIVLLVGTMIAGYLTSPPRPPLHQPSSAQSSLPAQTQVKPGP